MIVGTNQDAQSVEQHGGSDQQGKHAPVHHSERKVTAQEQPQILVLDTVLQGNVVDKEHHDEEQEKSGGVDFHELVWR